ISKANQRVPITVMRGGERVEMEVTPSAVGPFDAGTIGIEPARRPQVTNVIEGPADRAGLRRGDVILAVGGQAGLSQAAIIDRIRSSADKPLAFTVERDGQPVELAITPQVVDGRAMINANIAESEVRHIDPSFFQALGLS